MATAEERIRRKLKYYPETGKLFWREIETNSREDKIYNTRNSGKEAGCLGSNGYYRVRISGELYLSHRVAWFLYYGSWPENFIDHINHNRSDNRIQNLRNVHRAVQNRNTYKRTSNQSGTTGVYRHSSGVGWCAEIMENGGRKYLGYFKNKSDAIEARKSAQSSMDFSDTHGGYFE